MQVSKTKEDKMTTTEKLQKQLEIAIAALEKFCGDNVSFHGTSKVDARDARKALEQIKALNKGK